MSHEEYAVKLPSGAMVSSIDFLLLINERVAGTPPEQRPMPIKCTDRDLMLQAIPQLKEMEEDGRISLEMIGGSQENLF